MSRPPGNIFGKNTLFVEEAAFVIRSCFWNFSYLIANFSVMRVRRSAAVRQDYGYGSAIGGRIGTRTDCPRCGRIHGGGTAGPTPCANPPIDPSPPTPLAPTLLGSNKHDGGHGANCGPDRPVCHETSSVSCRRSDRRQLAAKIGAGRLRANRQPAVPRLTGRIHVLIFYRAPGVVLRAVRPRGQRNPSGRLGHDRCCSPDAPDPIQPRAHSASVNANAHSRARSRSPPAANSSTRLATSLRHMNARRDGVREAHVSSSTACRRSIVSGSNDSSPTELVET